MTKRLALILIICAVALPVWAVDGVGLDPSQNSFAARHLGLGGTSLGFSGDASGIFGNASSMADLKFPQFLATSRKVTFAEVQQNFISWAMPTRFGVIGLGYTSLNIADSFATQRDPASNRIVIDPSREATSYDSHALAISYAGQLRQNLAIGANLKFLSQTLGGYIHSQASAMTIDLSANYKLLPWLDLGANLQNILEGNLQWSGGASDKIGGFYKLGGKARILGGTGEAFRPFHQDLYIGIDYDLPHSSLAGTKYHLGLEYFPLDKIALRTGYSPDGVSFGVGFINGGFRFDYAYSQRADLPGDAPHYFSLAYVGERVETVSYKLKRKLSGIKWLKPKDRSITDRGDIDLQAEVKEKRMLDEKHTWTVTAISETFEVKAVYEYKDLPIVYLNGVKTDQIGTIETSSPLGMGRNVFTIVAYSSPETVPGQPSPEVFVASSEVRVLRFDPFSDTPMTHWAIEPIALSVTLGLVKGYPDDIFKPAKGISRAELVTLLVRTMPVKLAEEVPTGGFKDVPKKHWAAGYIAYGSYKGLVTGYPDGTFKPNKVLTRAEGVTILTRYANLAEMPKTTPPFPDLEAAFWANKYIAPARKEGLLKYLEGKDFEPSKAFSRAEACEVLYRTPQVRRAIDRFWETGATPTETQAETKPVTAEAR